MGLLDYFNRAFLVMIGVFSVFAIIGFITSGMVEIALLFALTLIITFSLMMFEYWKVEKEEKNQSYQGQHKANFSYARIQLSSGGLS